MHTVSICSHVISVIGVACFVFLLTSGEADAAGVSGSLTVSGQKAPLVLAYVDESPEDILVALASKEVPSDAIPYIGEEVARKFKIHAVAFTVSRSDKRLSPGFNGIFYPGREMGYISLGLDDATLQMKRLDAEGIEGRIFTPKAVAGLDETFSFDVTFSIPLGKAAPARPQAAVKLSGDTESAPTAAYGEYYRATHSGDVQKIRSFLAAAYVKDFDSDGETRDLMLAIMKDNPPEILIGKPVIKGKRATFTVDGLNLPTTKTSAEVSMVKEGNVWKVEKERWSTTSKE